ncbi:nucleotidyl transferase AbiEii/AbiGii toxin family protein [Agromyces fucosus]|uniref:nucleotidyl transferase AbiEii/AbiGii toxin family protein n=1 Tax=Agromyces fucosus TaxID=41985 RepID=UPI001404B070|nr:nucleotidyl transferase AbiEii/AbiGii toxin family protein [Agromyces fucosus]
MRFVANERAVDVARLRRQLVFQCVLARLAVDDVWVLKGGYCLEVRLGGVARATKDLDLAFRGDASLIDAHQMSELLETALDRELDDGFTFSIDEPKALAAAEAGQPGWRVSVRAFIGGAAFETVKLDVVVRAAEIRGGTGPLAVEPVLQSPEFTSIVIAAVDIPQHAAEKTHAYARIYAHDRPSSRVKDLVDLVLLIEAGLLEPRSWAVRLVHVFTVRDRTPPPAELPEPPESWRVPYGAMGEELQLAASDLDAGWRLVAEMYAIAVTAFDEHHLDME